MKQRSTSFWLLITRGLADSTGTQICSSGQGTGDRSGARTHGPGRPASASPARPELALQLDVPAGPSAQLHLHPGPAAPASTGALVRKEMAATSLAAAVGTGWEPATSDTEGTGSSRMVNTAGNKAALVTWLRQRPGTWQRGPLLT